MIFIPRTGIVLYISLVYFLMIFELKCVVRLQSQSYGSLCVSSPSERSGVSLDSWRNKHAATAGSLSKIMSLCPYLSTVHDFIPFNALSDMHWMLFYVLA